MDPSNISISCKFHCQETNFFYKVEVKRSGRIVQDTPSTGGEIGEEEKREGKEEEERERKRRKIERKRRRDERGRERKRETSPTLVLLLFLMVEISTKTVGEKLN